MFLHTNFVKYNIAPRLTEAGISAMLEEVVDLMQYCIILRDFFIEVRLEQLLLSLSQKEYGKENIDTAKINENLEKNLIEGIK